MEQLRRLFDFRGQATRKEFWLTVLALYAVLIVIGLIATRVGDGVLVSLLAFPILLALFVASLAVQVRRLHDRGKSAWWLLVFAFIPGLIGAVAGIDSETNEPLSGLIALLSLPFWIWGLVEMGFLPRKRAKERRAHAVTEAAAASE
ncbi:DUF805 domain-containing protein [Phenylobacterium sp. J367]|uniref:DUF805 domain-containing protein n=1 Tax=Phenylobacterium sp. J367 TaxID=2898435 RepID=UPI0021517DC8|nr:DUF805 domain-containing protein [Phenylobacterium sp. J367]MCR5879339.1 DUF805 domain-containing protein [Phenylobacterium sp. J367]